MSLKLSKDESNFTPIDEGQYEGVCFRVIDLGTREEQWKDSPPKKRTILHVSWEIQDSNNDNGEPHVLGKTPRQPQPEQGPIKATAAAKPFERKNLSIKSLSSLIQLELV